MRPTAIVAGPKPVEVVGLLLGTVITTAFGNSLQPISILAWLQPFVLLVTYDGSVRTFRSSLVAHASIIVAQAIGFTVAFAGTLSYPYTTLNSISYTFALGAVVAAASTLGALLPAWRLRLLSAKLLPPPIPRNRVNPSQNPDQPSLSPLGWIFLVLPVWAFPIFQSAVFTLVGFQLGHFHEPGIAVADWPAVAQLASLFGLWGINFVLNLLASAASCGVTLEPLPLSAHADPPATFPEAAATSGSSASTTASTTSAETSRWSRVSPPLRRHVLVLECLLWVMLVVGGGLVYSDSFFQHPVRQRLERMKQLPVSCIATEAVEVGSAGYVWLWHMTGERVAAGDRIVLWSEEAVRVRTSVEEGALLTAGRDLLAAHGVPAAEGGTYLGLTYEKPLLLDGAEEAGAAAAASSISSSSSGNSRSKSSSSYWSSTSSNSSGGEAARRVTNHFVLLGPNGTVLWNYRKAYPVPIVESKVAAGPRRLPTAPSSYGTLGGAICFDMDRPQYIRQAAEAGVDLLLQPSWTWGAVGPRHFASDGLRALENGFTTFRCSSDGVSGVVSPRGLAVHYLLTGPQSLLSFLLPLPPHRVRTLYAMGGWVMEWVNLGAAAGLLLVLLVVAAAPGSLTRLSTWLTWGPRSASSPREWRGGGGGEEETQHDHHHHHHHHHQQQQRSCQEGEEERREPLLLQQTV